ncbi:MAG TPA: hypothetical protein VIX20_12340 [Ktedonobacteraceae bacterium]
MAVATKTQTEQTHTKASPGTETTTSGEQPLRDELKEASQQFFNTLFRVGIRLALTPVSLLPEEPRGHFVSAAREFTRGFTTLAHEFADNVDKFVEEAETNLKRDL